MDIEQINKWKARQDAIKARLTAVLAVLAGSTDAAGVVTEPRGLTDAEATEVAGLEQEFERNTRDIASAERLLAKIAGTAQPLAAPRAVAPTILTHTTQAQRDGDKFKGFTFAAYVRTRILAQMTGAHDVGAVARAQYKNRPEYQDLFRIWAANEVAGGGEKSGEWGAELVALDGRYTGDFIDLLRAATCMEQLGLREVPANVTIKGQDGTGAAYWVGEGKPIPMSKADYSTVNLSPLKIGALSAISMELIRDSSPAALGLLQASMVKDSAQLVDSKFFSVDAASAGVSPAGILNGVSIGTTAGNDLNGLITDTDALVQAFITAKNTGGLKWVSLPSVAHKVGSFRNLMGQTVFPGVSENGGTYDGKPYLVTDNAGAGDLILIKPEDIYRIGDDGLSIEISREATLEFASDPTGAALGTPVAQSKQPVSLFQSNMVGVRLIRSLNWAKRRSSCVAYIGNTAYVPQIQTA